MENQGEKKFIHGSDYATTEVRITLQVTEGYFRGRLVLMAKAERHYYVI